RDLILILRLHGSRGLVADHYERRGGQNFLRRIHEEIREISRIFHRWPELADFILNHKLHLTEALAVLRRLCIGDRAFKFAEHRKKILAFLCNSQLGVICRSFCRYGSGFIDRNGSQDTLEGIVRHYAATSLRRTLVVQSRACSAQYETPLKSASQYRNPRVPGSPIG